MQACAQTVIATKWYAETKSFLWWLSNIIVLVGSAFYARIKQVEMEKKHNEQVFSQKIWEILWFLLYENKPNEWTSAWNGHVH